MIFIQVVQKNKWEKIVSSVIMGNDRFLWFEFGLSSFNIIPTQTKHHTIWIANMRTSKHTNLRIIIIDSQWKYESKTFDFTKQKITYGFVVSKLTEPTPCFISNLFLSHNSQHTTQETHALIKFETCCSKGAAVHVLKTTISIVL